MQVPEITVTNLSEVLCIFFNSNFNLAAELATNLQKCNVKSSILCYIIKTVLQSVFMHKTL